ncbi:MAG: segregation/condensation protein A [Myxococcales bacterium]|nr:segregation/condensation protein A [Myxococcales bacterium]
MNIPIAFVTEKYVEYIMLMQELNIDIASEYLVMAATLTHIKSKMLLPPDPNQVDDETEEPEEDPRLELVRRLLEYQKYKLVADQLAARSIYGRDVFGRGLAAPESESQAPLAPISLFKLLDSFQAVLKRAHTQIDHEIQLDRLSISDRINQLADLLRERATLAFEDLFEGQRTRAELVVTFLALLEMTRLRMTRLLQSDALAPIFVELAVREDEAMALAEAATLSLGGGGSMPPLAGDAAAEASGEANADESGEAGADASGEADADPNDEAGGDVGGEAGAESGPDVTTEPAGETTLNESAEAAPDLSDGGDEPQPEVPDEEEREDSD